MKRTRRLLALLMALAMMLSLASAAFAATDATSAEIIVSADNFNLTGKLAYSEEENALSMGASMAVDGENTIDLTGYFSAKALVLVSALLDAPYGIEYAKLAENLPDSVFAPDSGSQFALDQEDYDQLLELVSGAAAMGADAAELPDVSGVDISGLTDAIVALVPAFSQGIEAASKNMTMESSTGKLTINGTEVNVQTVKVQYGTASVIALYDAVLSAAKDDEAAQNAIATLIDLVNATGEDLGVTGAEFVQALVEHNQEMRDSMAEALGQYDIQCEVTASANEEGTALVEADVKLSMDGEPVEVKLQMSESLDYLRLDLNAGGEAAALVFAVTENSEDALAFRFSVLSGEDEDAVVYTQDKKAQTFDVSMVETVSGQTTTTTVSGHYVVEENLLSLVVDTLDGQDMGGSVTLNLRVNDTLTVPSFTEITELTEEELMNVFQSFAPGVDAIDTWLNGEAA
jgi:hypothetical protein